MLKFRRLFGAARALPLFFAGVAGVASAQDANTVGNPQLKGFTLPGERTVPAQPVTPPPTAQPAPSPPTRQAPAAAPRAERQRPAPPPVRKTPQRVTPPEAPGARATPQAARVQPGPPPLATPQPEVQPAVPAPQAAPAPVPQATPADSPARSLSWLWLLAGLSAAAAVAAVFLLRRRRGHGDVRGREALAGSLATARWREPEAEAAPEPEVAPAPVPEGVPEPQPVPAASRALIEIDIDPDRASALEEGARVQYKLLLTNRGDAPAGNIRIDGRMFNASADGEVDAFFRAPIHELSGSPHVLIAPGETIVIEGQIGMTRDELQPIEVQGRVIFVPLVAMNVAYDWEGGSGRTSKSWLVGRQASAPAARMGAFRLDLGPRIYRQVERREAKALVA